MASIAEEHEGSVQDEKEQQVVAVVGSAEQEDELSSSEEESADEEVDLRASPDCITEEKKDSWQQSPQQTPQPKAAAAGSCSVCLCSAHALHAIGVCCICHVNTCI